MQPHFWIKQDINVDVKILCSDTANILFAAVKNRRPVRSAHLLLPCFVEDLFFEMILCLFVSIFDLMISYFFLEMKSCCAFFDLMHRIDAMKSCCLIEMNDAGLSMQAIGTKSNSLVWTTVTGLS